LHAFSLPPSKHYKTRRRGTATVEFDLRVVVMLEWLVEGFGGVSSNFEIDSDRYGGDFMHDANFGIVG
jgi:hypothetical protein